MQDVSNTIKDIKARRKSLQATLSKTRSDKKALGEQVFILNANIASLKTDIAACDAELSAKNNVKTAHVTDHALIRYLERVQGIDIEAMKTAILTDDIRAAMLMGATRFSQDGVTYILESNSIVTILD